MATVSLRPRQYKRLGRLAAKNPERAERVAGRMVERDTRKERGKEFVKANVDKLVPPTPTMKKGGSVKKSIKKAQSGDKLKPTYKNLRMGVANRRMQAGSRPEGGYGASKEDSALYRAGFARGLRGEKEYPGEPPVQKMGRWEGQNAAKASKKTAAPKKKMKDGGKTPFGMLSVKAGIDKNPNPTQADRIAGAKMKAGKMKKGGKVGKKK